MTAQILTPLALQNEDVLRALAGNANGAATKMWASVKQLADYLGRDDSNLGKSLRALHDAGLIYPPASWNGLTGDGARALAALDRAAGSAQPDGGPYLMLRHDQISSDPENARKHFDPDALADLADTMHSHGLKQKLSVREHAVAGLHRLTMGERRWRAWGLLIEDGRWARDHVEPCWIDEAPDDAARTEGSLIENLQREDLNHAEIAEAFEALATKYGRSNREIADRVGRTAEYVQQHRRLMKLDDDELEAVRQGETSMHDALRAAAADKPDALTPRQLMILAEWAHKAEVAPRKGYSGLTEVQPGADTDADLKALVKANILSFTKEDWQTHRAYVSRSWAARELLDSIWPKVRGEDAAEYLDGLRRAACRAANVDEAAAETRYVTTWLNGPFFLTASAMAAIAEAKDSNERQKAQAKAEKERRAARLKEFKELDAHMRASVFVPIDDRLSAALAKVKIVLPLELKGGKIKDATGADVFNCNWRFGDMGESINLLLATLVNAAGGYGPAPAAEPDDVELTPALKALAGVPAEAR